MRGPARRRPGARRVASVARSLRPERVADAVADAVAEAARDERDDRALRRGIVDALGRSIPFGPFAFLVTDPETAVGVSPLAEVPDLSVLPRLIRAKYLTPTLRWTALPPSGVGTLARTTGGRLDRSPTWVEVQRDAGVSDVLSAVLRDRHGTWGFLDLWRTGGTFEDAEIEAVATALPVATTALRRAVARTFPLVGGGHADHPAAGVLLVDDELRPSGGTAQLRDWLARLLPAPCGADPVPASALNVAAQLLSVEAGVDAAPAVARVHAGDGLWLSLRAARLEGGPGGIAVTYDIASASDRLDVFVRAHGLTERESQLVRTIASGADTRAAARRLGITELTVQDHLRRVFARAGVRSRSELLSRATGW